MLMVVGESGLGKSTLVTTDSVVFLHINDINDIQVNSMFLADIYGTKEGEEEKDDRQTLQVDYN